MLEMVKGELIMRRIKGKNLRAFKLTALTIILVVLCTCSAASASNLRVSSEAEGDYISIQAAVDAAEAGDTIFVSPGTYVENLKINKEVQNLVGFEKSRRDSHKGSRSHGEHC